MRRILSLVASAALILPGPVLAQVTQTGTVVIGSQTIPPQPTTQFNQSCNGGAGGIVGQVGSGSYSSIVCAPAVGTVTGSITANAGTNLNTSALALETGGNLATVATAQGAAGTGITQPTGGSGVLGWLSGIYKAVTGTLTVQQQPYSSSSVTDISPTNVGVASAVVDTAQTRRSYLMLHNPSALGGAYVSCDFGPTAALNGSGTATLYPGQYLTFEGTAVPNAQFACIASAAATPFTVYVLEQ